MPDLSVLLTTAVVALAGLQLTRAGFDSLTRDRSEYRRVLARLRWWMLPAGVAHLAVVLAAYAVFSRVPGADWGWFSALTGSPGNAVLGQTGRPEVGFVVAAVALPVLLAAVVPRLALFEEVVFRYGNHQRGVVVRVVRAVAFGFAHCLVGVPLAAGAALVLSGVYYDLVYSAAYRRQPVEVPVDETGLGEDDLDELHSRRPGPVATYTSAAAHTVTNWLVLSTLLLPLLLAPLTR